MLHANRAIRALHGVLLADASHPWTAAACLELGNWDATEGKLSEAVASFERLADPSPNSPYVSAAFFNLGIVHLEKHDVPSARTAFFRVIDQSPGSDLALKAHVRIGICHLENEEFKEAVIHLRRAQRHPNSDQHAHVIVALAAPIS